MQIKTENKVILIAIAIILGYSVLSMADENSWSTNGPSGGSVVTIAIHPIDNRIIYVGTIQNGIYKSVDGGDSWTPLKPGELNTTMRVIKIHPIAPDTIYAATAKGMFKSANAGLDWTLMRPPLFPLNEIRAFLIHPVYPNILFAGGPAGNRWKSTDGGRTWYELNTGRTVGIEHFIADPQNPNILYFTSGSMPVGLGIWKSDDMGESWYSIQNNLDSTGFGEEIAVDPVDSDILYVTRNDYRQQSGHCVSKSTDGGISWFDITPPALIIPIVLSVRVSPFDHNTVFICTSSEGIFKSTNGGETWERRNEGLNVLETKTLEFDRATGVIFLGTYTNGVHKSSDGGESWQKISHNINLSPCWDIAIIDGEPPIVYATSRILYRSPNGGLNWEPIDIGMPYFHLPSAIEIDRQSVNNIYIASQHGFIQIPVGNTGFYRSIDSGESWQFFNSGLPGENDYVDIAISYAENGARRIFLASFRGLYYSDDFGETWDLCDNGLPIENAYFSLAVAPSNQAAIGVSDASNRLFLSTDRGDSWAGTGDIPDGQWPNDIKFDPIDENIIYFTSYFAGLFKSTDAGVNWININNNLPVGDYISISGLDINPLNPENLIVCSSRRGVYQSHNGGDNWEPLNDGLDTVITSGQLFFIPGDTNSIFLASNKSVWSITRTLTEITDENIIIPIQFSLSQNHPNPFNAATTISYTLPEPGEVAISIYNLLGQRVATIFEGTRDAGEHTITWDADDHPSGVYFARLETGERTENIKMVLLK